MKISFFSISHIYGLKILNASSGVIGNLWLLLEAAVLSYSLLSDDILESINLLLLDGTTLVEFNGIYVVEVFAAGIEDELLLDPLVYKEPWLFAPPYVPFIGLIVFK